MKEEKRYFPMLAGFGEDLFSEQSLKAWEKKELLPKEKQEILVSDKIAEFIYGVEKRFNLDEKQTEYFAISIRKYFFGEINDSQWKNEVMNICHTDLVTADKLLKAILSINETKNNNPKNIDKISLEQVMKKYPHILKQKITNKTITAKPFLNPLTPTVKNWIMVYEKTLGATKHNVIDRGEFVFRSDATRGLSEQERQKLLELFKSRDENTPLNIDIENNVIVFGYKQKTSQKTQRQTNKKVQKKQNNINKSSKKQVKGNIRFSSNHVLPVEKDKKNK